MSDTPLVKYYDEVLPYEATVEVLTGLARYHARQSGPWRQEIDAAITSRNFNSLLSIELLPPNDCDPLHYYHARQAIAFFEKLEPLELGVNKESVAWGKFLESEEQCRRANIAFGLMEFYPNMYGQNVQSVLFMAARKVSTILGDVPSFDDLSIAFGPGANTSVNARVANARSKLGTQLACSAEAAPSVGEVLHAAESMAFLHDSLCDEAEDFYRVDVRIDTGKLQFVPKNAKTYRSIVVEPLLNSLAQKGIGSWIRDRLARHGVDLSDQTRNQMLAREGSVTGELATVDLSAASDTISKAIVSHLLPHEWYSFLCRYRTGRVSYRGTEISLEKFSSMGNGFTFELESLLFYSLAHSVCRHLGVSTRDVSVYGDDIILPSVCYPLLDEVLTCCGFKVNAKKSFHTGPFRESCGKDFLRGIDVRPFYQKTLVSGATLFTLHNFYMRQMETESAAYVASLIHPSLKIYGPDGYGDGHLIGSWGRRLKPKLLSKGYCGSTFDTYTLKPRRYFTPLPGDRILPGYSIYVSGPSTPLDYLRGETASTYAPHREDGSDQTRMNERHYVIRGSVGYSRRTIYTLRRGVFI